MEALCLQSVQFLDPFDICALPINPMNGIGKVDLNVLSSLIGVITHMSG